MVLVLHRTGAHGHIRKKICQIPPIFRIQHFICRSQAGFLDVMDMELSDGNQAFQQVGCGFRIRLVNHSFIALSGGAGLIRIDSGNYDAFILDFFLYRNQTVQIVHNRGFIVSGARPDNNQEAVIGPGNDVADFLIPLCL